MCPERCAYSRLKKTKTNTIQRLLTQIHKQETAYKRLQCPLTYADLVNARDCLWMLIDQTYTRHRDKTQRFFYEFGNKCGRPLVRSLHPRSTTTYVQRLNSPDGPDIYDPLAVSSSFQQYYSDLYNIRGHFHDMPPAPLSSRIREYIGETMLKAFEPEAISSLMEAFTADEIKQAMDGLPIDSTRLLETNYPLLCVKCSTPSPLPLLLLSVLKSLYFSTAGA